MLLTTTNKCFKIKAVIFMERQILHIDVNNAFLSWSAVERLKKGETLDIRTIPAVIGGDESLRKGVVKKDKPVQAGDVYVDGNRIGEIGSAVIKDRQIMAKDGILVVIVNVNMKKRQLLITPNITTRGFILVNENEELIHKIESKAEEIIREDLLNPKTTFAILKTDITETLHPFINNLTGRRPIILPVIMEVKK